MQLSKWRECRPLDAEKLISQWEKVAKCNFKSKAQSTMKDVLSHEMKCYCNAEDRFSCVELFARASQVRASMHIITSLEILRTLMLCLVQLSKWENTWPRMLKSLFSVRESCLMQFKSKLKYMKDVLSHEMKCYLAMQKQIFMCWAFLQSKSCQSFNAQNH